MKQLNLSNFNSEINNGTVFTLVLWYLPITKLNLDAFDFLNNLESSSNPQVIQFAYVDADRSAQLVINNSIRATPWITLYDKTGQCKAVSYFGPITLDMFKDAIGITIYEQIFGVL